MHTRVLLFVWLVLLCGASEQLSSVGSCHRSLNQLLPNFSQCYEQLLVEVPKMSEQDLGSFVCLTGKMHLFGMQKHQSKPDLLLAYYYIKLAAEMFEVAECRYHLGVMYNYKMTPHFTLQTHLAAIDNKTSEEVLLDRFVSHMHLTHGELNLFLAALDKQPQAMMVLANQNRRGISTTRNCTAAALYYSELVKQVYVQDFLSHSFYRDPENFQRELYLRNRISTDNLVESQAYIVQETATIGIESFLANYEIAQNYYYGRNGFRRNYTKAVELFEKLEGRNDYQSALLGICYFKGLGVKKDYTKARSLFASSAQSDLSRFMLAVMEYYGIEMVANTVSATKKFKDLSSTSPQAKAFYGSLIMKGLVPNANYKDGMTMLEEASAGGNQHAKMIIGLIYLDGTSLSYDCEKGISYLFDSLIIVDNWWDKIQNAKQALHIDRPDMALFRYIQLALVGDSVGMINGLYLLETFPEVLDYSEGLWNHSRVSQDRLFPKLLKEGYKISQVEQFLFGDFLQFVPMKRVRQLLKFTSATKQEYKNYIKKKLLFVCRENGESICKFISYKEKQEMSLLKELANHHSNELHILESRYLLGKKHQQSNRTEQAKAMYRFATGSGLVAELIWYLEGGDIKISLLDDFFLFGSIIIVFVGIAYVHRNMVLIKIQQKHNQTKNEEGAQEGVEEGVQQGGLIEPPNPPMTEQVASDQPVIETSEEGIPSSTWLKEKDE